MAAFILIGSSSAIAQSTVIGKVVDENDAPLIGATVIVPGTSTGTGTDAAGNFSLKVDAGTQSVEISFIGYVTETREIKGGGRIDLGTIVLKTDAVTAMKIIDQAITDVSDLRAQIGAVQANMLQTNENNLRVAIENITKTESNIRDTDMASEMTEFTKDQILTNAGVSMLGQANSQAQSVLALLGQ